MEEKIANSDSHEAFFLNFIDGNYEYVNSDEDDGLLDNGSTSFFSESLASENFGTESTTNDCEIEMRPFVLDEIGFEKARTMADINENEELTWENIDVETDDNSDNVNSMPILESESEESAEGTANKRGNNPPFSCKDMHDNDATEALKLMGNWILSISESAEQEYKKKILSHLSVMLNKTELCPVNNPTSLLYIKTALRLKHVNIIKIKDKNYDFTTDTSIKVGEALGIAVLRSRHEVQENKKKLEEPDSIEDYQSGFPSCLSGFFKGLITVLVKKKFEATMQKRKERESGPVKRLRRQTTENEKKILNTILDSNSFSEVKALEILDQLENKEWDLQRIRRYWNNNRYKKSINNEQ
ncbi:5597_t:CDS:2 [Dentiscutata erythropus]|uniref:5597_t:CDS:1 n=1 Tax=Dentiscutata erythropus TaxID=1348616 RepID=A0A9N8WJG9_9GLOM|nr:5597_t:CDS:2 [Dentiscutata erythropus]